MGETLGPAYNIEVEGYHCLWMRSQGLPVPNASAGANPNLRVVQSSSSIFEAVDSTNSQFFIKGVLVGGLLKFMVVARLPSGPSGAVSGKEFFDAMMANFQANVTKIEGHWLAGIDLDANIQQFNYWTGSSGGSLSDQDAAKKTWTGKRAEDHQFNKVAIVFKDPPHAPGNYLEVIAHFSKGP